MPTGTVFLYHRASGFGLISPDCGSPDAFVHESAVQASGMTALASKQRISYDLRTDLRGQTCAHNIKPCD